MRKHLFAEWDKASIAASASKGEPVTIKDGSGTAVAALETLVPGPAASGPVLALTAPISFWGGVDPKTSVIADVRHPQHGTPISGTILYLPGTIGSSSASAILLELIHRDIAPAAIILKEPDAILLLGVLVAREMGWATPAAYRSAST
jgi:predicted aconitase with swiveling domain